MKRLTKRTKKLCYAYKCRAKWFK